MVVQHFVLVNIDSPSPQSCIVRILGQHQPIDAESHYGQCFGRTLIRESQLDDPFILL
jgi:hypothetical protein